MVSIKLVEHRGGGGSGGLPEQAFWHFFPDEHNQRFSFVSGTGYFVFKVNTFAWNVLFSVVGWEHAAVATLWKRGYP